MLKLPLWFKDWFYACCLITVSVSVAQAQSDRMVIERIDAGVAAPERSVLRIGQFNPIRVDLKNGPTAFSGSLQILTDDPDGIETVFETKIQLGPGQLSTYNSLINPGQMMPRILARVVDENGRSTGVAKEFPLDGVNVIEAAVRTVGVIGPASGVDQLPMVSGLTSINQNGQKNLEILSLTASRLPARVEGLESLDSIVLDTSNPEVLNTIDTGRASALKAWVADGGHLVIVAAGQRQALLDSSLKDLLPAIPSGSTRAFDLGAIESLVGSRNPIVGTGKAITVTKFERISERAGMVVDTASSSPILVRGVHGFGRVTLVGVDVHDGPFAAWKDRTLFWAKALELKRKLTDTADAATNDPLSKGGSFYQNSAGDMAALVRSSIDQFKGIKVVGFGLVVSLILGYLVAIGPGDYLLVKYGIKKPELTWLTFPLIVIAITTGTYLLTYRMKGQDLRINKIDVLDIDYVGKSSRGWSVASIFSPINADYDASFAPATAKSAEKPIVSEAPALISDIIYQSTSWFDSPDDALGGTGRPSTLNLSTARYRYAGLNGVQKLEALRIPIWSTKSLEGRWMAPGQAISPVRPDLTRTGTDRVTGRLTNLLDEPLEEAILVYQSQVYDLGSIAPGASVVINPTRTQNLTGYLDRFSVNELKNTGAGWSERARLKLPRLMMFHESGPASLRALTNGPMSRLDLSGLLALNRPMLVARVKRPGSQLVLTGVRGLENARIDQTTLVRCLLPLASESVTDLMPTKREINELAQAGGVAK